MEMTNGEIVTSYKQAKHKAAQIGILAELNRCSNKKIVEILVDGGIKPSGLNRVKGELKKTESEPTPDPKPTPKQEPVKEPEEPTPIKALATLYREAQRLMKQKQDIEDELAALDVELNKISDYIAGRSNE